MKETRIALEKEHKDGSIIIMAITIMTFLLFFVAPDLFQKSPEKKVTDKFASYVAALSLAEAGVERAIWELNHGDISSWRGNGRVRTLTISSHQAPASDVIGDIEIRIVGPEGENPSVRSTGRVTYTDSIGKGKPARVLLERTTRVDLERNGYNWVCSFPQKQTQASRVQGSTI